MMNLLHLSTQKIIGSEDSLHKQYNLHIASIGSVFLLLAVICLYVQPILTGILKLGEDEGTRFFLRSGLFLDDAFYYLKTAYNIFHHSSVSFDLLNLTNGFHPLWMIICIPFQGIHNSEHLLLLITVLEIVFYFSASIVLAKIVQPKGVNFFAVTIISISFFSYHDAIRLVLNGLETSLHIFILVCTLWGFQHFLTSKKVFPLFFLLPLLFLSRIESIILCFLILGFIYFYQPSKDKKRTQFLILTSILVVAIYVAQNLIFVGEPFPISGTVKRLYSGFEYAGAVKVQSARYLWFKYFTWPLDVPWMQFIFITNLIALPVFYLKKNPTGFVLAVYCIFKYFLLVFSYKATAGAYTWYYSADLICATYFLCWLINALLTNQPRVFWVVICLIMMQFSWIQYRFYVANINHHLNLLIKDGDPKVGNDLDMYYLASKEINKMGIPKDTIIGIHNAGVFGFFSNYRVVNMDGLINGKSRLNSIKRNGYDFFPYIDEDRPLDLYIDILSPGAYSAVYRPEFLKRGYQEYPIDINMRKKYGSFMINEDQGALHLFMKSEVLNSISR
jgi:hypothetical protein